MGTDPGRASCRRGAARLRCPDPAKLSVFPLYDCEARGEQTMRETPEPIEIDDNLQKVHCIHCGKTLGSIEVGSRCALWCQTCRKEYVVTLRQDGA